MRLVWSFDVHTHRCTNTSTYTEHLSESHENTSYLYFSPKSKVNTISSKRNDRIMIHMIMAFHLYIYIYPYKTIFRKMMIIVIVKMFIVSHTFDPQK